MTGTAIGKLGALVGQHRRNGGVMIRIILDIIFRLRPMTAQAPTHVHHLRALINRHLAYVAVTIFAIQACRDMRTVINF